MCSSPRFREEGTDTQRDPFRQRPEGPSNRVPGAGGQTWADPGLSYCVNLAVPLYWITKYQTRNLKSIAPPSPQVTAFLEQKDSPNPCTEREIRSHLWLTHISCASPLSDIAPNPADAHSLLGSLTFAASVLEVHSNQSSGAGPHRLHPRHNALINAPWELGSRSH